MRNGGWVMPEGKIRVKSLALLIKEQEERFREAKQAQELATAQASIEYRRLQDLQRQLEAEGADK